MLYTVNRTLGQVLTKLGAADRVAALSLNFSRGWDESIDRKKGRFVQRWGAPDSWDDVILQGPHLHVNNPLYKVPNPTMKHNQDWSAVALETLPEDAIPATSYKPAGDRTAYDKAYTHWDTDPARAHYRIAWREMAANSGERTLITAIIPPGYAHINAVHAMGNASDKALVRLQATLSSIISDFSIRSSTKNHINAAAINRLALPPDSVLDPALMLRALRLNSLTDAYASLWRSTLTCGRGVGEWALIGRPHPRSSLLAVPQEWDLDAPLRNDLDRRDAQVEIDALVALMLGVTADELCTVYRTQFAVLYGYDHDVYFYDANGRLVPNPVLVAWRKKGDKVSAAERTHTNASGNTYTYELPFRTYDREKDMRTAYAEFERRLKERT